MKMKLSDQWRYKCSKIQKNIDIKQAKYFLLYSNEIEIIYKKFILNGNNEINYRNKVGIYLKIEIDLVIKQLLAL